MKFNASRHARSLDEKSRLLKVVHSPEYRAAEHIKYSGLIEYKRHVIHEVIFFGSKIRRDRYVCRSG